MIEYDPILIYILTITYTVITFLISLDLNNKLYNYSSFFNDETWIIIEVFFIFMGEIFIKLIF